VCTDTYINIVMKRIFLLLLVASQVQASQLVQQFKSSAFNGNGYSNYELSLESMAYNRNATNIATAQANAQSAAAAAANTPAAQFMSNLQARIFSQVAANVTNQLFSSSGNTQGSFTLPGGALVNWYTIGGNATLSIYDPGTNTSTQIQIPISSLLSTGTGGG